MESRGVSFPMRARRKHACANEAFVGSPAACPAAQPRVRPTACPSQTTDKSDIRNDPAKVKTTTYEYETNDKYRAPHTPTKPPPPIPCPAPPATWIPHSMSYARGSRP